MEKGHFAYTKKLYAKLFQYSHFDQECHEETSIKKMDQAQSAMERAVVAKMQNSMRVAATNT